MKEIVRATMGKTDGCCEGKEKRVKGGEGRGERGEGKGYMEDREAPSILAK